MIGIVLAFGRLYHDSEMAAAQACGVGVARVAAAVWLLALPVTALVGWLNFDLAPRAAAAEAALRTEAMRAGDHRAARARKVSQLQRRAHRGLCARRPAQW